MGVEEERVEGDQKVQREQTVRGPPRSPAGCGGCRAPWRSTSRGAARRRGAQSHEDTEARGSVAIAQTRTRAARAPRRRTRARHATPSDTASKGTIMICEDPRGKHTLHKNI